MTYGPGANGSGSTPSSVAAALCPANLPSGIAYWQLKTVR